MTGLSDGPMSNPPAGLSGDQSAGSAGDPPAGSPGGPPAGSAGDLPSASPGASSTRAAWARERILSLTDLQLRLRALRAAGKRIVFTNGCFDLLHAGHATILQEAAALGDVLVVGLNTDESVRRLKGAGRPIVPQEPRALLLAALRPVDYVVFFGQDTPAELIEAIVPDVLVKGADYRREEVVGADVVEAAGGEVVTLALVPGFSTSDLIRRVRGEGAAGGNP